MTEPKMDPRMIAGIDLARRMGMREFQLRYSDDEQPVVWLAVAAFSTRGGRPVSTGKINAHVVGAALDPAHAVMRLLDELGDGGECAHCHRPTGVAHDLDAMPLASHVCWHQFDPELETYRRSCEGDT